MASAASDAPQDRPKQILIAYDGSERAQAAVAAAGAFMPGANALVLNVFEPARLSAAGSVAPDPLRTVPEGVVQAPGPGVSATAMELETPVNQAMEIARRGVDLATSAGLSAEAEVVAGRGASGAWSAIIQVANERQVDLIVMGARGHSAVASMMLGSVSDGVVHHARRPVLLVPLPER